ncbi:polyphenol oxidase family protein [Capillimicrobium parvum]|uniref:Polyphenol oxidase n=1 Tax=Capillimicrobium parvum TaxID=2884022 RepID=A0A9E7C1C9_9ACTN|nr:polyphenol oxidase family protein [Capillimicrobium parvum]UGS36313.1 Polyphenol oxidase [Capillimicrobium parvum]
MFHWDGDHLAADLPHGARALFTTRRGGVSEGPFASLHLGRTAPGDSGGDTAEHVAANRARLAQAAGERTLRIARQVHGADVATDDDPRLEADAQVTTRMDVAATVLVADCLPVALATPHAVAMVHAGWRGLAGGVLRNGLRALGDGPVTAAIGPAIGVCCFEVGDEVRAAFPAHPAARRRRNLDLKLIARRELQAAGVQAIEDCDLCTFCEPRLFFSHRRDGERTGRQAGVAWRS